MLLRPARTALHRSEGALRTFGPQAQRCVASTSKPTPKPRSHEPTKPCPLPACPSLTLHAWVGQLNVGDAIMCFVWTSMVHVLFLGINYGLGVALALELPLHKSLVLVGSSKTLPMALSVLTFLPKEHADNGILAIPMLIAHIGQVSLSHTFSLSFSPSLPPSRPPSLLPSLSCQRANAQTHAHMGSLVAAHGPLSLQLLGEDNACNSGRERGSGGAGERGIVGCGGDSTA
jgi:hypothetical protein